MRLWSKPNNSRHEGRQFDGQPASRRARPVRGCYLAGARGPGTHAVQIKGEIKGKPRRLVPIICRTDAMTRCGKLLGGGEARRAAARRFHALNSPAGYPPKPTEPRLSNLVGYLGSCGPRRRTDQAAPGVCSENPIFIVQGGPPPMNILSVLSVTRAPHPVAHSG